MFDIDYDSLVRQLLPYSLRKQKITAFIVCLIKPVDLLYLDFKLYRDKNLKRLNYTGQVIYLEKLLNDTYNTTDIYIEDIANVEYTYISNKDEGSYLCLSNKTENNANVYLVNNEELIDNVQFIVKIPLQLYNALGVNGLQKMRALINNYRIASKQFIIESI